MKNKLLFLLLFSLFFINRPYAQKFGIAAIAGVNLAQINGDNQRGFKKVGAALGIRSIVNLEEKWKLHVEILHSQRGASPSDQRNISLNLNYAETPIYLSYQISNYESTGLYRIYAGGSFGRLISYETTEIYSSVGVNQESEHLPLNQVSDYFNKTDIGIFAGMHLLPIGDHFGIDIRQTFSANLLFDKTGIDRPIKNESLRSYFISIRLFYEINNIGDNKKKKRRRRY